MRNNTFALSGQVRLFNVHIQSKLLYRTPVTGTGTGLRRFLCPGQGKKGGGSKGGPLALVEIWRNLDGPPKNKEFCSYVVSFEL